MPPLLFGECELGERVAALRDRLVADEEDEEVAVLDRGAYPRVEGLARGQRRAIAKDGVPFSFERQLDARRRFALLRGIREKDGNDGRGSQDCGVTVPLCTLSCQGG